MKGLRPSARSRLLTATLLTAVSALAGCGGVPSAAPQPPPHLFANVPSGDGQPLLPPPADTTVGFGERVHAELGYFPEFGGTAIDRDRTRFTIRWHGEVPAVLREIVDDYAPHAPFDIVIEDTEFLPGDLRAEAGRLILEHSPVIQGAGPRPAGDGVDVTVSPEAVRRAGSAEAALADNGVVSDYPIYVLSVGDIEPA
jgi:hypothetical protein